MRAYGRYDGFSDLLAQLPYIDTTVGHDFLGASTYKKKPCDDFSFFSKNSSPFFCFALFILLLQCLPCDQSYDKLASVQNNHDIFFIIHGPWQLFRWHGMITESVPWLIMFHEKHFMACHGSC